MDGAEGAEISMNSEPENHLTNQQVQFITSVFEHKLPVYLYGGYAEETLLHGDVTRSHHDVDFVALRKDASDLKRELTDMGYEVAEMHEEGADQPYKFLIKSGPVEADVALLEWDEDRNQPYGETRTTDQSPIQVYFDKDIFNQPPLLLKDHQVHTVSPLAQMQMRSAFSEVRGGQPRSQDVEQQELLRQKFYPHDEASSKKFKPEIVTQT